MTTVRVLGAMAALVMVALTVPPLSGQAQAGGSAPWDVTLARGQARLVEFTTEEGTSRGGRPVDVWGRGR